MKIGLFYICILSINTLSHASLFSCFSGDRVDSSFREKVAKADIKTRTTSLLAEIRQGNQQRAEYLLEKKANPNIELEDGESLLIYCALKGNAAMVRSLLKFGAQVNHKNELGNSALSVAVPGVIGMAFKAIFWQNKDPRCEASTYRSIAALLIAHGADGRSKFEGKNWFIAPFIYHPFVFRSFRELNTVYTEILKNGLPRGIKEEDCAEKFKKGLDFVHEFQKEIDLALDNQKKSE